MISTESILTMKTQVFSWMIETLDYLKINEVKDICCMKTKYEMDYKGMIQ